MMDMNFVYENLNNLTGAELKLILFLLKHANEKPLHITTDEFQNGMLDEAHKRIDSGTGLSSGSISESVKKLICKKLLICYIDNTDMGRVKKYYMLSKNEGVQNPTYAMDKDKYISYEEWLKILNLDTDSKSEEAINKVSETVDPVTSISKNETGKSNGSNSETLVNSGVSDIESILYKDYNIYKSNQSDRSIDNNIYNQSSNHDKRSIDKDYIYQSIDHVECKSIDRIKKDEKSDETRIKSTSSDIETLISNIKAPNQKSEIGNIGPVIDAIKNKYNLSNDEIDICISRMKGKIITYPAKYMDKVAENYVKEKSLMTNKVKIAKYANTLPKNSFNSYSQRKYNIDELERFLLTGKANDDNAMPAYTY